MISHQSHPLAGTPAGILVRFEPFRPQPFRFPLTGDEGRAGIAFGPDLRTMPRSWRTGYLEGADFLEVS
jgi:hypothetical protein